MEKSVGFIGKHLNSSYTYLFLQKISAVRPVYKCAAHTVVLSDSNSLEGSTPGFRCYLSTLKTVV